MNELSQKIRIEIERDGPISFARFMELALYAPGLGFYEQTGRIGRGGDYFTSVSTGPLFGQLLAFQFAQWIDSDLPQGKVQLVEAGAHDGTLAADILDWMGHFRPDLIQRLDYYLIESSPTRRAWQRQNLSRWKEAAKWVPNIAEFGEGGIQGIVFSNEFLDALPVHRLMWDAGGARWRECRVIIDKEQFVWLVDNMDAEVEKRLPAIPQELARVLPDGFITEVNLAAMDWWAEAARALDRGKLFTIDYGFRAAEWLRPDRPNGTIRAFSHHHANTDLLSQPGEQDLTADVNFSALAEVGRAAGLGTDVLLRQSQFLTQILAKIQTTPEKFAPWDQKCARQFQTLAHPEHLGHPFHVLIQY